MLRRVLPEFNTWNSGSGAILGPGFKFGVVFLDKEHYST